MATKISALAVGTTPASTDIVGAGVQGGATVSFTASAIAGYLATATLAAGTITTSQPMTLTQIWNAAGVTFTCLVVNPSGTSAAGSLIADFQFGGVSKANITKAGTVVLASGQSFWAGGANSYGLSVNSGIGAVSLFANTMEIFSARNGGGIGSAIITSNYSLSWGSSGVSTPDLVLTRKGVANLQHGDNDAAAPVAQTTGVQSVVAGTSNTAGTDWTLRGSQGTGTGVGGDIAFKTAPAGLTGTSQNALAEVMRILAVGNIKYTNAANFSANGSVATSLGSVGPTGSHTTVQTWLTFVDNGGTTRYVPCF